MSTPDPEQAAPPRPTTTSPAAAAPPVDLDALTERVYRLLLRDLRQELARGAAGARRKER